uniref:Integrin alpha-2 domain-containing protein n=1 Tax=Anopheles maculatus TaxID=74869 RepID=A0A182T4T7_9DIPT
TVRDGGRAHVPRTVTRLAVQLIGVLLLLVTVDRTATAFNLETINYILQEGEPNSMFGFSVVLHREQNKSWVIVGAPTANTTQNNVIEGGAVYRCDIYDDHRCFLVPFDTQESAAIIELQAKHNVTSNITHVKFDLYGK